MSATISSINYCPVKSVSFQSIEKCKIKKDIGIIGDRIFAFTKDLNLDQAKLFEKSPSERKGKWNKILTLKNSPALNKYNFIFEDDKLTLILNDKEILTIDIDNLSDREMLSNKISELESSLKQPIVLMKNYESPFFDTSISKKVDFVNSVSLLNVESINDFQKKIDIKIEPSIFRGNICIEGIEPGKSVNGSVKLLRSMKFLLKLKKIFQDV